jgi:hypothetical protein
LNGWRIDVVYSNITPPLPLGRVLPRIRPLLPTTYSPLTAEGRGNQGYLYSLPDVAGRAIAEALNYSGGINPVDDAASRTAQGETPTEKDALAKSRIGQGKYRKQVLEVWGGRCAVTGLGVEQLLKASHVKPWRDCDNHERLDKYNSVLLSAAYDAAFDCGLITFGREGRLQLATGFDRSDALLAGIDARSTIAISSELERYLRVHRTTVFKG